MALTMMLNVLRYATVLKFIEYPAQNRSRFEKLMMKLTTKSQIEFGQARY